MRIYRIRKEANPNGQSITFYGRSINIFNLEFNMLWVLIAGIGKEIFDLFSGGVVDIWDIVATIAGGYFMWLIMQI